MFITPWCTFVTPNYDANRLYWFPPMNRITTFLLLMFVLALPLVAQSKPAPAPQTEAPANAPAKDDISGMYSFLKDGEFVQINQEEGGYITGFVSRFGDDETNKKPSSTSFSAKPR